MTDTCPKCGLPAIRSFIYGLTTATVAPCVIIDKSELRTEGLIDENGDSRDGQQMTVNQVDPERCSALD